MPQSNDDACDSLLAVVAKHHLTLPATRNGYDNLPWRFGKNRKGTLPSFDMEVTLLATNGVVAWFLRGDDSTFWGHLANFKLDKSAEPIPTFWRVRAAGPKKERGPSKAQQIRDSI